MQQLCAPAFDQSLVGKRLEALWKYVDKVNSNKATLIWTTGHVVHVADGPAAKSGRSTKKAKQVLPAGAVLWAWDADSEFDEVVGEQ